MIRVGDFVEISNDENYFQGVVAKVLEDTGKGKVAWCFPASSFVSLWSEHDLDFLETIKISEYEQ